MFERYTERARRVIFFARYEASQFGSPSIETEHLLLGLVREDKPFRIHMLDSDIDSLRKEIERHRPSREKIATSVDLPLSRESKQVLAYASEEAEALHQDVIDSGHFVMALLRTGDSLAATLLRQHGIGEEYRDKVRETTDAAVPPPRPPRERAVDRTRSWYEGQKREAAASLRSAAAALEALLDAAVENIDNSSEEHAQRRLKRKPWSRKQALGHLIDLATAHHQWLARALVEPRLAITSPPQDDWVSAQQYESVSWPDAVDLWICLNRLLLHLLLLIPEEKASMPCRIGIEEPIPLLKLIESYIAQSEDIIGQIMSHL